MAVLQSPASIPKSSPNVTAFDTHDAAGQLTQRIWKNPDGTTYRTEILTWDLKGRLSWVTGNDVQGNGYEWFAVYDALGRKLMTGNWLTTNGASLSESSHLVTSHYDPEREFLELAVLTDGRPTWKLYGPDMDGTYGGLNGVGGLDAVITGLGFYHPAINDARGNVLGTVTNGISVSWNPARPTSYGSAPGYRPLSLVTGATVAQASAWRGKYPEMMGYVWLGARYYDPDSGSFLNSDPVWNGRDPNYYSFCGSDPINYFDADGRLAKDLYQNGALARPFRAGAEWAGGFETSSPLLGGAVGYAEYWWTLGANMFTPASYVDQAAYDYEAQGGGALGVLGAANRYNPTKPFFDAGSGIDMIDAHQLSGVERTSAGLNAFGSAVLFGSSVARTPMTSLDDLFFDVRFGPENMGSIPNPPNLRALTTEAHTQLGFKGRFVSTAVGEYADGSLGIASSDRMVPLLQAQWAEANGIQVVNGLGHAEMTLVRGATDETGRLLHFQVSSPYGRQVVNGVPTNPHGAMCPDCAAGTAEAGARTTSPVRSNTRK